MIFSPARKRTVSPAALCQSVGTRLPQKMLLSVIRNRAQALSDRVELKVGPGGGHRSDLTARGVLPRNPSLRTSVRTDQRCWLGPRQCRTFFTSQKNTPGRGVPAIVISNLQAPPGES